MCNRQATNGRQFWFAFYAQCGNVQRNDRKR